MRKRFIAASLLAAAVPFILSGCSGGGSAASGGDGGGGGGGPAAVTGLSVASNVSVVDAQQTSGTSKLVGALRKLVALSSVPADSDYNKDTTNVYVNEKAGEAFKSVNMILCMVEQTKYADMVNKDYYKAMVNSQVCQGNDSADKSGSSTQGGTSASSAPSYDIWTVKSERATSTSDQILTAYVHMAEGGPTGQPMTVHAKMTISEGKSATNPLGIFTMTYKGFMDADPAKTAVMKGILKTERNAAGEVVIKFGEKEFKPDLSIGRNVKAAYSKDDTAKTGHGSAYQYENYGQVNEGTINFAYNESLFKRVNPATNTGPCLDRTKFETSAWRYGVYSTSGSRKNMNGGFPINTKQDGSGSFGYLGYYGLNLPPSATALADGDKVYKKVWGNGTEATTEYTLFVRGGKLKKHTRSIITLGDIKNIPLEGSIPTPGSNSPGNTMYRITWGDDGKLAIRASATMSMSGPPTWTDLSTPTVIDNTYTLPFSNLGMYSQALGGQLNIQLNNCSPVDPMNPGSGFKCDTPDANTKVVFFKESTVYPSDTVPATLACFDNCPKAASIAGIDGTSQQTMTYQTFNNEQDYTFTGMVLNDKATGFDAILLTAPTGQSWGFNSGPLVDLTAADPATGKSYQQLLACDWNTSQTCGWKAWNALPVFYTWETGPNTWNKFSAVKDATGAFVKFDPPKQAVYTHSQTDTSAYDYKYNGTKFFLQYNGFGDLQGIPGRCVNPNDPTAVVTDCSQPGFRWVPEFTIPADSTVTIDGIQYLVKPLDMEQRMKKIAIQGACSALSPTDMSSSFPNVDTEWVDPNLATEPTLTAPPKVIGGVVQ